MGILLVLAQCFCFNLEAQVVTDIFPTRVTTQSIITVLGTGFSPGDEDDIRIEGASITTGDRTFVSSTELSVLVTRTAGSTSGILNFINSSLVTFHSSVNRIINYVQLDSKSLSNTQPFFVEEIFTNWDQNNDGVKFWKSSDYSSGNSNTWPDDKHELVAFRVYNPSGVGKIYSTGIVDVDSLRTYYLPSEDPTNIFDTRFRAYSTNGVQGKIRSSSNFLLTGNKIDDVLDSNENRTTTQTQNATEIAGLTVYRSIIDGRNGLELATGISNFNVDTDVRFFSGNGQFGTANDDAPDLLITQIAQAGGTDIYYYADNRGNVVGTPIRITIPRNGSIQLAKWKLDLFEYPNNQSFVTALPSKRARFGFSETRPISLIAFKLSDFDINDTPGSTGYVDNIENINLVAGGTADTGFLAYNTAAFDIKVPVAEPLLPRFVCRTDGSSSVTFEVSAFIEDGSGNLITPAVGSPEELFYDWSKFNISVLPADNGNPTLTVSAIDDTKLATYNVLVSNSQGAIILPVELAQGGTPTFWNGTTFELPLAYQNAGITVQPENRSLQFLTNFDGTLPANNGFNFLEACDCIVAPDIDVIIGENDDVILYDELIVEPGFNLLDGDGNIVNTFSDATFTLENNANLIQTKDIDAGDNINSGNITMRRFVDNLETSDYVYWSSPVNAFNIDNLPGDNAFMWEVNATNPAGTTGNWESAAGESMAFGRGYIKRVPSSVSSLPTSFTGLPRNGRFDTPIELTNDANPNPSDDDWNLIGNPYPSSISAEDFLIENAQDNGNIEGAVYLWTHANPISTVPNPSPFYNDDFVYNYGDQYLVYNSMGATPVVNPNGNGGSFNGFIAAGQGFFVKALTDGSVTFSNSMRHNNNTGYNNSDFFRKADGASKPNLAEKEKIWISIVNEQDASNSALIGYATNATIGKDVLYDAPANEGDFGLYSLINQDRMIIQGRPLSSLENDIVPLAIKINQTGVYDIAIDHLEGAVFVDDEQAIFLEDTYLNIVHDLRQSPYTFTADLGDYDDRFFLRYNNETLNSDTLDQSETFVFIDNDVLKVRSNKQIKAVEVFDLTGKRLVRHYVTNEMELKKNFNYAKGVYLINVLFNDGKSLNKKVIN